MGSFDEDYAYSRRFLPHMKEIVGRNLIGEAPEEEDRKRATDLVVLRLEIQRIACRAREFRWLGVRNYRNQFTIRARRPSGADTELRKIVKGWGDYILYGFASPAGDDKLCAWVLADLDIFREWRDLYRMNHGLDEPGELVPNGDRSSWFRAYTIEDLPTAFIVERQCWAPKGQLLMPV